MEVNMPNLSFSYSLIPNVLENSCQEILLPKHSKCLMILMVNPKDCFD